MNRALNATLLAVMMSMHARLGAESGLKVLEHHLVMLICDLLCMDSKSSSPFGKAGVFACPLTLPVGRQVFCCLACVDSVDELETPARVRG